MKIGSGLVTIEVKRNIYANQIKISEVANPSNFRGLIVYVFQFPHHSNKRWENTNHKEKEKKRGEMFELHKRFHLCRIMFLQKLSLR
mmetsp:Transcript_6246/g.7055  ORF Transcript_6246/g.7055 Transcript_6246/m.7055 type:complete len:87 (-) Transcript_6246:892-1152(-)